jgi:4-amino-4-deoxy-L-arabinose transferase-like glycosyltransferase
MSSRKYHKKAVEKKVGSANISLFDKASVFFQSKEKPENRKIVLSILIATLVIGLIIRLVFLGNLFINEDEAYTMTAAKRMITGTGSAYQTSFLFTILQYFLFLIFGINEIAARVPSAIFGTLSIGAIFYFCKKFINTKTALLVAVLTSISFFEVFFSRTARPYSALQFSYIVLSWFFITSFKNVNSASQYSPRLFMEFISIKKFSLFMVLFMVSILIHPWTVLFWVTTIFFLFVMYFYLLISKKPGVEKYLYLTLGIVFILVVAIGWLIIESGLFTSLFQQKSTIDVIVPDFSRTYNFLKDDPFKGIMHYFKLFSYDFNYLWIFAFAGFAASFFIIKNKMVLVFIHSMVFSNLIILGFIIHVLQQRYFFPVYPFYLIYVALGIYSIYFWFSKLFRNNGIVFGIMFVLIIAAVPYEYFSNLYSLKMTSNIYLDSKIGEYSFYPYRNACKYVNEHIKPGEAVLCTMPRIAEFYIDRDILGLRQVRVNLNKFNVADELVADTTVYPGTTINHASFVDYLRKHKSGWLIADARINTVISQETRDLITQKMDFSMQGSDPLTTMLVAHWDSTVFTRPAKYFWVLHKLANTINLPYKLHCDPDEQIMLSIVYSGVEKQDEASCNVGGVVSYIPPNTSISSVDTADWVMKAEGLIKTGFINFTYHPECGDSLRGFMVHDIVTYFQRKKAAK